MNYRDIIFFDHVELIEELNVLKGIETPEQQSKKRFDLFMLDQYNYPVIIELKNATTLITKRDRSHNKDSLTSEASMAISQLINYSL